MTLTGHSLIAGQPVVGAGKTAFGLNPATNAALEPAYTLITEEQLTTATSAAAEVALPDHGREQAELAGRPGAFALEPGAGQARLLAGADDDLLADGFDVVRNCI